MDDDDDDGQLPAAAATYDDGCGLDSSIINTIVLSTAVDHDLQKMLERRTRHCHRHHWRQGRGRKDGWMEEECAKAKTPLVSGPR